MKIIEEIDIRLPKLKYDYLALNELSKLKFPYDWVFYLYFERFYVLLSSCKSLLNEFNKFPNYDMPIGLMLRTMILDSLTIIDIFSQIEETKSINENENINKLLIDNLIRFFNKKEKSNDELTINLKNEFEKKFGVILNQLNVKSVDELLKNRNNFYYKSAKKIYESIKTSKLRKYAYGYHLYLYYSKYEHFGLFYPLQSRSKKESKIEFLEGSFDFIFNVIDRLIESTNK